MAMLELLAPEGASQVLLYSLPLVLGALYVWASRARAQHSEFPQATKNNLLFGHMAYIGEQVSKGRPNQFIGKYCIRPPQGGGHDADHSQLKTDEIFVKMCEDEKTDVLFLDLRPYKYKLVLNINGPAAEQITKATPELPYGLPRADTTHDMDDILGPESIFSNLSEPWKELRKRYNPGFQAKHLYGLIPEMVKEMEYCIGNVERLSKKQNGIVELFLPLTRFSFDVIGIVALEESLGAQRENDTGLGREIFDIFEKLKYQYLLEGPNGWRPDTFVGKKYYGRKLTQHLGRVIQEKQERAAAIKQRSIIGLTLNAEPRPPLQSSIDQMKTFLFAGHDTTAASICFAIYELSRNPSTLAAAEAELHRLFNLSPSMSAREKQRIIADAISARPEATLNSLEYMDSVIKETLRLWSPASNLKMNRKDPFTFVANGTPYTCIPKTIIYTLAAGIHTHPRAWGPTRLEFRPERWLGKEFAETTSKLVSEGWYMPFGKGPRHCIGQQMAMMEMKLALSLLLVSFDFEARPEDDAGKCFAFRIVGVPSDNMKLKVTAKR